MNTRARNRRADDGAARADLLRSLRLEMPPLSRGALLALVKVLPMPARTRRELRVLMRE